MNERTKQLWKESQQWNGSDDGRGGLKILESVEKFAKLIGRECLTLADSIRDGLDEDGEKQQALGAAWVGLAIERHFMIDSNERKYMTTEPEPEKSQDKPCVEDDGCPTEKAVLQRFWREHQAQPEQKPVAWISHNAGLYHGKPDESLNPLPLYTAPPQREWVGLTDAEAMEIEDKSPDIRWAIIQAEAKLKGKNNA
jgi:hypothetical protein